MASDLDKLAEELSAHVMERTRDLIRDDFIEVVEEVGERCYAAADAARDDAEREDLEWEAGEAELP
jgi:hypothetical protein